ncbi:MAG: LysR family transcriptional regulator, partial [Pseudomonadota bacterium]
MTNVTLRQFRYFDALARHGHFARSSVASAISGSSVTPSPAPTIRTS